MDSGTHGLLQTAGFDLIGNTHQDSLFRGYRQRGQGLGIFPEKLVAQRMPDEVRGMLSVEKTVDVSV